MKESIRSNNWLIAGIPQEQLISERILAVIGAKINLKRLEMEMDQKAFAKYMGVTQGLVSRWESGNYNFTISNLASICQKLNLNFDVVLKESSQVADFIVMEDDNSSVNSKWNDWIYNAKRCQIGGAA